jgi:hypothetical protein
MRLKLSEKSFSLDDLMNAAHAFVLGGTSLASIADEHPALAGELEAFDPLKLATAFSAFLTVPELQSNCLRLEALVQLGLAVGSGARKPQPKHLMRWFADLVTGRWGAFEDPAEDVFVSLVATPRGNFRVLEGIWESGTFYLQRVIEVVERMPTTGAFAALRESVYALLSLSVRQVVDEERRFFIPKLSVTLRGARPRALRGAARRGKRTGEAGRVLPAGHKSAEPVKAGRPGTSDPDYGPASVSVMERETEPMADAPLRGTSPMRKWARRSQDLWSAGAHSRGGNRGCSTSISLRESLQGPRVGFRTG